MVMCMDASQSPATPVGRLTGCAVELCWFGRACVFQQKVLDCCKLQSMVYRSHFVEVGQLLVSRMWWCGSWCSNGAPQVTIQAHCSGLHHES